MKRIKTIKELGLVLIVFQTLLGFFVVIYGALYIEVDTPKAEEMLEFIRSNNTEYYEKLKDPEDQKYLKEFYKHYEVRGNRMIMICGLFFIVIAINIAIIMVYLIIAEERKKMPPVEVEETEEAEETEEVEETEETEEAEESKEEEKSEEKSEEKEKVEEVEEKPEESKESAKSGEQMDEEMEKVLGAVEQKDGVVEQKDGVEEQKDGVVEQKDGGEEHEAGNGDDQSF